ncbi:hypothetical protein G6F22_017929 [Rhizopus arrhizus]|nr:hypothetical protein G6F22_017929 [Rhizopus arrhizus]
MTPVQPGTVASTSASSKPAGAAMTSGSPRPVPSSESASSSGAGGSSCAPGACSASSAANGSGSGLATVRPRSAAIPSTGGASRRRTITCGSCRKGALATQPGGSCERGQPSRAWRSPGTLPLATATAGSGCGCNGRCAASNAR